MIIFPDKLPSLGAFLGITGYLTTGNCGPFLRGFSSNVHFKTVQGMDGSARKPALLHDTDYIVEKTHHLASYFGSFEAYYLMTHDT